MEKPGRHKEGEIFFWYLCIRQLSAYDGVLDVAARKGIDIESTFTGMQSSLSVGRTRC